LLNVSKVDQRIFLTKTPKCKQQCRSFSDLEELPHWEKTWENFVVFSCDFPSAGDIYDV